MTDSIPMVGVLVAHCVEVEAPAENHTHSTPVGVATPPLFLFFFIRLLCLPF